MNPVFISCKRDLLLCKYTDILPLSWSHPSAGFQGIPTCPMLVIQLICKEGMDMCVQHGNGNAHQCFMHGSHKAM